VTEKVTFPDVRTTERAGSPVPSSRARLRSLLTALPTATLLAVPLAAPNPAHAQPRADAPGFEQRILFEAGRDPGYACFRIPAIVRTTGDTLLARVDEGTVGLLYEAGAVDARDEIRFTRFTEDRLTPRRGPDPTTPDHAPLTPPAVVLGGARETAGAIGGALAFDGTDDAVRLPYRDELPLDGGDFTASLWFRYTAEAGKQPLLWMGGVGTTQPQVWLRGEPASGRVRGLITVRRARRPCGRRG
jgi:hypothetical protein